MRRKMLPLGRVDPGPTWTTAEGGRVPIRAMASKHLLSTIHLIERNRAQELYEFHDNVIASGLENSPAAYEGLEVYTQWHERYPDLLAEAERRGLIKRR